MSSEEKLEKIRKMIESWANQPDPGPGEEEQLDAADVLCAIQKVAELSP